MSFLSLQSLNISPSPSCKSSPGKGTVQLEMLEKSVSSSPRSSIYFTPRLNRKHQSKFFRKPSFFNKKLEVEEEKVETKPSYLGQIYKNVKFKLTRSFNSKSSCSSQVLTLFLPGRGLRCFLRPPNS